jgi:membrane associated rhomboid family serine protease
MTPTPVGMRCPECSKQKTKVVRVAGGVDPVVTWALIGLNVLMFFGTRSAPDAYADLTLVPGLVGEDWFRVLTSGFLHATGSFGFMHIFLNMYMLWILGPELERALGRVRFLALYLAAVIGGSFLVVAFAAAPENLAELLRSAPNQRTVGASGAIFGLFGGAYMYYRARGEHMMTAYLGPTILMNLAFTLLIPFISIGGHLGGLLVGGVAGILYAQGDKRRTPGWVQAAIVSVVAVALWVLSVVIAPTLLF